MRKLLIGTKTFITIRMNSFNASSIMIYAFVSINVLKATNSLASKAARNYESQEVLDANIIIAIHDFNLISVLRKLSS